MKITVDFRRAHHQMTSHEYTLDVEVSIAGGGTPFVKQYRVNSNEKSSAWERFNTNASEGRAKATQGLLERLVPDIQAYVAARVAESERRPGP
jgi:hypothetical protein